MISRLVTSLASLGLSRGISNSCQRVKNFPFDRRFSAVNADGGISIRKHRNPIHTATAGLGGKAIQIQDTNRNMRDVEYAVRGPIVLRAEEIEKQLKEKVRIQLS